MKWGYGSVGALVLTAAFAGNIYLASSNVLFAWLATLVVVAISLAFFGTAAGRWEATFIDNRNRISLSKLQVILWTIAILSAVLTAGCFNSATQSDVATVMGIVVDPKLWGLLGISLTTAIGQPLALAPKTDKTPAPAELTDTRNNLAATTGVAAANIQSNGHVLTKANLADARWSDLIHGDDVGNADNVDFSKVQQLYFTLLTLLIFGLAVADVFKGAAKAGSAITQLPTPDAGYLGLLGASGAGYLAYKAMSHSQDAST